MESFPEPATSTRGQNFVVLGLAARPGLRAALFPVFLALYLLTLLENGLLACLAGAHPELRKPMYFFLANLSCLEMSYVSVTSPTLLLGLRAGPLRVPFAACLAQLFFFITFLCTKCSLLASMAYDRYVAICRPLHYPLLMRPRVCLALAVASWLGALAVAVVRTVCMASLSYCGPHVLNHFFCDVSPLLRLSCTRVALEELLDLTSSLVILRGSLLVAVASYVAIGRAHAWPAEGMESFPEPANSTRGQYFVLLGLAARPSLRAALFPIFLALYLLTLLENGLLACLAGAHPELRKPMYFFLANLSCLEMSYVSVTSPTLLLGLRAGPLRVPFAACLAQLFFFITFLCTKCSLLASMAYDRYVAICRPLHYPLLMRPRVCLALAVASWLGALAVAVVRTACMASLSYCGPHVLNHFFCDVSPLLRLSCTRVALVELLDLISALVILWGSLLVAVASYAAIGRAVLRMPSAAAWRKAFSTCASHLAVLGAFYSVVLLAYSWPGLLKSTDLSKVLSVLYSVITPACSPVVYGLRSREVRAVLRGAREP